MSGVMIASPSSGSGKTTVTLGLLRALTRRGVAVAPGKAGPDYIDPAFHHAACGGPCLNFDAWSMRPDLIRANAAQVTKGGKLHVVEAMMGLFDGAADGTGSAGELARLLQLPAVLVVDCSKMAHSVAALVAGFAAHDPNVMIAGVILNRVASDRHETMLRKALERSGPGVLGVLRASTELALPERHLGLVQAAEHAALEAFIDKAADAVEKGCDMDRIRSAGSLLGTMAAEANISRLPPLGQRTAIARDVAFSFVYEHMLLGWRRRGAEISEFSPLAGEGPSKHCDAVYLPGGYPELHAGRLSAATEFRAGMQAAIDRGARVYGECGGYMVLGDGLTDAGGVRHAMLGALPLETSFADRQRHLGYRRVKALGEFAWADSLTAHEFHYARTVREGEADRLFQAEDALGTDLGSCGMRRGQVAGSFMHVIDLAGPR